MQDGPFIVHTSRVVTRNYAVRQAVIFMSQTAEPLYNGHPLGPEFLSLKHKCLHVRTCIQHACAHCMFYFGFFAKWSMNCTYACSTSFIIPLAGLHMPVQSCRHDTDALSTKLMHCALPAQRSGGLSTRTC